MCLGVVFTALVVSRIEYALPSFSEFLQRVCYMQSAVLAIVNASVRPSVCPSHAGTVLKLKTTQATIMRSSL